MSTRVNETTNDLLTLEDIGGVYYLRPSRMPMWGDRPVVKRNGAEIFEGADYVVVTPGQWLWKVELSFVPVGGEVFSIEYAPIGGTI